MKPDHTISIRQFRQNSGNWFDRANAGQTILINHHDKDNDCYLVPVKRLGDITSSTETLYSYNQALKKLNKSLKTSLKHCYWVIAIEAILFAGLLTSLLWGG